MFENKLVLSVLVFCVRMKLKYLICVSPYHKIQGGHKLEEKKKAKNHTSCMNYDTFFKTNRLLLRNLIFS